MMNGLVRNDAGRPNNTWQNLAETVISFHSLPRLFITVLSVMVPMFGFITFIAVYATPLSPIPSGDGHKTHMLLLYPQYLVETDTRHIKIDYLNRIMIRDTYSNIIHDNK